MVYKAINFADNHLSEPITLKDAAANLYMSYSHFYHVFEKLAGEPYGHYIKRHRLEMAAGLLRYAGYSIGEVGERCGYATKASFSKAFASYFSNSATDFRRLRELQNEKRTLHLTASKIAPSTQPFFENQIVQEVTLPSFILYYDLVPRENDPIGQLVQGVPQYDHKFHEILEKIQLPNARVITGTLDAIPVTNYEQLYMYFGLLVPVQELAAHQYIRSTYQDQLLSKELAGGRYLQVTVQTNFVVAGMQLYGLIERIHTEGYYKLSSNNFFLGIIQPGTYELNVPVI
ncbi:AraC-type DNA-binding protein [Chitinophaga costaii]|uniref:AraC-type DNA-binding protein n=2 Tax=Chitinophaga costaii TaxID=1335309 RepID=A0A1C4CT58_9BACT|nr:AraC-type DNA-binding protein [Chitinophaga costaii]